MKKIPGVETVEASLKQGKAVVQLKPGNTVHLEDLVQKVRDNAFNPKEARISARGELLAVGGKLQLKILGANDVYDLVLDPKMNGDELRRNVGKVLLVEAVVPASKDKTPVRTMELKSYKLSA